MKSTHPVHNSDPLLQLKDFSFHRNSEQKLTKVRGKFHKELELRYLLKLSDVRDLFKKGGVTSKILEQRYFPKEALPRIVILAKEAHGLSDNQIAEKKFSSARLRKVTRVGKTPRYFLELKSNKTGPSSLKLSRAELSVPLSRSDYIRLLPSAHAGLVRKKRLIFEGEISVSGDRTIPCRLQVDYWLKAGKRIPSGTPSQKFGFVTADLELPSQKLARLVRLGRHSISMLDKSMELSALPAEQQSILSNRRLACKGFDKDARSQIRRLLEKI